MTENTGKAPTWFKVVAVIAILWNAAGVYNYIFQVTSSPDELAAAYGAIETEIMLSRPAWATAGFALAVWGGLVGSILLLMRKSLATPVLLISLVGVIIQQIHGFFMVEYSEPIGADGILLAMSVLIVSVILVWLSRIATARGWSS